MAQIVSKPRHLPWWKILLAVGTLVLAFGIGTIVGGMRQSNPANSVPSFPAMVRAVETPTPPPSATAVDVPNPPVQDVIGISVPTTPSIPSFSEQLNWEFMETEIHSLYKNTRPLFMREFAGWFRAEDGSIRPIAEFKGNSMSDEDRLGASVDGIVFARNDRVSIDGAEHWIRIDNLPSPMANGGPTRRLGIRGALRVGDKIVLYGGYDYQHEKAGISATNWYRTEAPAATLEELSR